MKMQYLGTAAAEGIPAVFCQCETCQRARRLGGKNIRTRSQAIIDDTLLIDLPPDTYWHSIQYQLNLGQVKSLLITHSHQDHFYPLELLMRAVPYAHDWQGPLTVYGNSHVKRLYDIAVEEENDSPRLEEAILFQEIEALIPFTTQNGYLVTPLPATHKEDENCFLFLIEKDGKRIFYGNDSCFYSSIVWEFIRGKELDLISLDSTMGKFSCQHSHMGIPENIQAYEHFQEMGCIKPTTQILLNHFSHNGQILHDEVTELVAPYPFQVAYDGMTLEI